MAIQFPALTPALTALIFVIAVVAAFLAGIFAVFMSKTPKRTVTEMVENAYDRGYANGKEDLIEARRFVQEGEASGYDLAMMSRYSPETLAFATALPVEGTIVPSPEPETVIASSGYHLVKWEPEPDPLSDTWLQEQLAALGTWSENQEHKLWRWAHALNRSGRFTNTETGESELCPV